MPDNEYVPLFNRRGAALGITITFTVLAWLCSIFRIYMRLFVLRSAWWDDVFIALALITSTTGSINFCLMLNFGMGSHFNTLLPNELQVFLKHFYIGAIVYPLALTFIKLALLFQYLRIFDQDSRRRFFCKWLIGLTSIWGLVYSIPSWVPCYPVASMWDFTIPARHCWGYVSPDPAQALGFYISHSVTTALLDLVIFVLPVRLLFRRKARTKMRIALVCLFVLGLAVMLCSISRLVYSLTPTLQSEDLSWNGPTPTGLAVVEICLASICAALPIFWPVIENSWGIIFVTYQVEVKRESGIFIPRKVNKQQRRRSASSNVELTICEPQQQLAGDLPGWDPYVGDAKTGLGESDAIVESPAGGGSKQQNRGFRLWA
ncbi:hypothetical protein QBC43DRAFT_325421 [Cladorrhinum sp. PSN259]|nr:hypothetical protein QBC43DRAFT_325421 [Cladorrhinum sp. PSN259]